MTPPPDEVQAPPKYRPLAEIGRGGMAAVCLAVATGPVGFHKLVVLKQARPEIADDPEFLAMFLDEARLAARLNHPNVIQTYEVGHEGGRYFIAMEYLDGQPLHRIRARIGPNGFLLAMQIRILIEALAGLHYAHELTDFDGTPLAVVHRDATPHNVFVTYDGVIKVVDFGIAKAVGSSFQTALGVIKGKVPYMAPEQARGERADRRADLFAVGVMLWEAIAGERMWKRMADVPIIGCLAEGQIPDLSSVRPNVDPALARICRRALAPEPAHRYPNAAEFQNDLERWLERQGEQVTARTVGHFVAAHFAEERASIKAVIEQQLGASCRTFTSVKVVDAERSARDQEITVVDTAPPSKGPMSGGFLCEGAESADKRFSSVDPPSEPAATLRNSSVSLDALPELRPAPRFGRPNRAPLAIGSALLVAGTIAVGAWTFGAPLTGRSGAPGALTAPGEVDLTVRVWPTAAHVSLDGALISIGEYNGKLPRDGRVHWIRAEALHFIAKERAIVANGEVIVNLTLEREPAGVPRR
jgi:eukaryotic-like serine/threonine-protein kinase